MSGAPAAGQSMAGKTLTIEEFGRRWRQGKMSAVEVTEACLQKVTERDGELNAFIRTMKDDARQQAMDADRERDAGIDRGPLHGVPISIKDLLDVQHLPTTAASRVRDGHVAVHDAPALAHLRRAGAIFVGKTNLHEFAFGTTNDESAFGPSRNPWDVTRSPGGSSGGSAASVAAGMALGSVGTDTGGSIRIPAAACGLVGLKPEHGEISTEGVVPLSRGLDHVGPLATTVSDAWHLYQALLGHLDVRPLTPLSAGELRLAVLRPYFCDVLDPAVRAVFESAVDRLGAAGARIHDAVIRHADQIAAVYLHLVFGDAAAYHAVTLDTMPERYTPSVRQRLEAARYVLAEDYVRALAGRRQLRHEVDAALADVDALLLPTLPIPAPLVGATTATIDSRDYPLRNVMLRLTQLFNLSGHPAVSLSCGFTPQGLPCGLQLVGARTQTTTLMRIAQGVESALSALAPD